MINAPSWLDRSEYPFTSRCFDHGDGRMHYVDEGQGPVVFFVHGTPDWSFGFRHLVKALRGNHRCVAIDHLGFGLSDKPPQADYTAVAHAHRLQRFIDHLGLTDITLVVTDFGGGIGLQHALEHPTNVKGIVLYNTWMWDLMPDKRFSRPSAYGDKSRLTKSVHAHYKNALPDAASRAATFACVQEIANAGPFWNAQWERVSQLKNIPTLIAWGLTDRFFPPDLLERWKQALPHALVRTFPDAGHFLHEEQPEALASGIRELVAGGRMH